MALHQLMLGLGEGDEEGGAIGSEAAGCSHKNTGDNMVYDQKGTLPTSGRLIHSWAVCTMAQLCQCRACVAQEGPRDFVKHLRQSVRCCTFLLAAARPARCALLSSSLLHHSPQEPQSRSIPRQGEPVLGQSCKSSTMNSRFLGHVSKCKPCPAGCPAPLDFTEMHRGATSRFQHPSPFPR